MLIKQDNFMSYYNSAQPDDAVQ